MQAIASLSPLPPKPRCSAHSRLLLLIAEPSTCWLENEIEGSKRRKKGLAHECIEISLIVLGAGHWGESTSTAL